MEWAQKRHMDSGHWNEHCVEKLIIHSQTTATTNGQMVNAGCGHEDDQRHRLQPKRKHNNEKEKKKKEKKTATDHFTALLIWWSMR